MRDASVHGAGTIRPRIGRTEDNLAMHMRKVLEKAGIHIQHLDQKIGGGPGKKKMTRVGFEPTPVKITEELHHFWFSLNVTP